MKIVLDANILVSALIKSGKPRELLFRIAEKRAQLVLSRGILEEFLEVTDDPMIRNSQNSGYTDRRTESELQVSRADDRQEATTIHSRSSAALRYP